MIVTIAGLPGAGKSTVKDMLAAKLGYSKYSMGDLRGKMALERGMTIDELNALGEKEAFTDKDADDFQKRLGETEDDFVIEGRLGWLFIPHSVKVLLTVQPRAGAERVFEAKRRGGSRPDEKNYASVEDAQKILGERIHSDVLRYNKWYGVDMMDPKNYDLVIDTTEVSADEVVDRILALVKAREAQQPAV